MHRWLDYNAAHADLENMPESQRLGCLLDEYDTGGISLTIDELRRLFLYVWADGANPTDLDSVVLALLRWIAPVRDVESYLAGTHIIYRAAEGSEDGIRWTLDENLARQQWGNNIVRGEVESNEVLAHLTASGKDQVLVDPDDIYDVRPV